MSHKQNPTANSGTRWRVTICQDGKRCVGSIVMSEKEARDNLEAEYVMHQLNGWQVETILNEPNVIVCTNKKNTRRRVAIECFSPFNDFQNPTGQDLPTHKPTG